MIIGTCHKTRNKVWRDRQGIMNIDFEIKSPRNEINLKYIFNTGAGKIYCV
jgi:hypothetical protein